MDKEQLESLLIDYIDGKLNEIDRAVVAHELAHNAEAQQMYKQFMEVMNAMDKSETLEPGTGLRTSFKKLLQEEIKKQTPGKTLFFQPMIYRMAAGLVLIMAGIAIGYWINKHNQREEEIANLKKEIESTKQMMLTMIDNQQSASQRIQGVNVAMGIEKADDEVVNALAKAMTEDPNTNVRLAALEALSKFHQESRVRKILITALSSQTDPVVQISLIQLLVRMKERGVVKDLERIVDDNKSMKAVKDEAYTGLLKLS